VVTACKGKAVRTKYGISRLTGTNTNPQLAGQMKDPVAFPVPSSLV